MKKKLLLVTSLLTLTLLCGVINDIVQAAITPPTVSWKWLGYAYDETDAFHRADVYAYKENSTATLSVTVTNPDSTLKLNVSALKVGFDWGKNYTSSQTTMEKPFVIPPGETRVIPIIFTVPNLTEVSNLIQYSYTVYLEHVNSTTAPRKINESRKYIGGTNFVVYSSDQVDAQKTMQIVDEMLNNIPSVSLNSTKAKLLRTKAVNETFVADMLYGQGDFTSAKNHYKTALSMINEALDAEEAKGAGFDDAQVQLLQAQAKALEGTANYLNGLSNMWVLIGVAAVLFGLGYIIRGFATLRKPTPPT